MNSSTFTNARSALTQPSHAQIIREFVVAWFKATPVYLVYRALTEK